MQRGFFFFLIVVLLTGFCCLTGKIADLSATENKPVKITFIHLNDLHAHLVPHPDVVPDALLGQTSSSTRIVEHGGVARIATMIKRIRSENPNSILMNIGDTYHGGVEALFTQGNAISDPVNALKIDVGVPGNWDFAYGPLVTRLRYTDLPMAEVNQMITPMRKRMDKRTQTRGPRKRMERPMRQRRMRNDTGETADMHDIPSMGGMNDLQTMMPIGKIKRPSFPNLAANVTFTMPPMVAGKTMCPPTMIKEVNGVKVGFIGITSDIVPYMHAIMAFGFSFLEGEEDYKNLINRHARELREQGANLVVVMSELGIQKDYRLAQVVEPGVNIFFSAHTHETTFEPLSSKSGAIVVEAGNDGYLGRMDVTVNNGQVVDLKWRLLSVGKEIQEDPEVKALVDRERAPFFAKDVNFSLPKMMGGQTLTQPIDTVVGSTNGPLDRRNALESSFNRAMTDLLRNKSGTQLSLTPGFRFVSAVGFPGVEIEDNTVATGSLTLEDVYRFFPVPYTISTAELSGRRLREIMEQVLTNVFSLDVFKQKGGWFDGFSGVGVTLDLSRPDGKRITGLRLADINLTLTDDTVVSITGCSRPMDQSDVLCSYSGFTNVRPLINNGTGSAWTPVDIFIDALRQGPLPGARRRDIKNLHQTQCWPETPYIQPLSGIGK